MMVFLECKSVSKVREAMAAAGVEGEILELPKTPPRPDKMAEALDVEVGAVVKAQVFMIDEKPVVAFVSGDHTCKVAEVARALNMDGAVREADAVETREATGFARGGVAPVGPVAEMPAVLDVGIKRFETLYIPAGHPYCFIPVTVDELKKLSGGIVSYSISDQT